MALPLERLKRTRTALAALALAAGCASDVTEHSGSPNGRVSIALSSQTGGGQQVNIATALDQVALSYGRAENPDDQTRLVARVGPRFTEPREEVVFDLELDPGSYFFHAVVLSNTGEWLFTGGTQEPVTISGRRFRVDIATAPVAPAMIIEPGTAVVSRGDSLQLLIRNSGFAPLAWRFTDLSPSCLRCVTVRPSSGTVAFGQPVTVTVAVTPQVPAGRNSLQFEQFVLIQGPAGAQQSRLTGRVAVDLDVR